MGGHGPTAAGTSSFGLVDRERLFDGLGPLEGRVVLDLACGAGAYSLELARRVGPTGTVHAVDLWKEGIARLAAALAETGIGNVRPAVADVSREIPLADGEVDLCLMATVLHDLVQDGTEAGALREVRRVLRPGGVLAIVEFQKVPGPPGPPLEIRIDAGEVARLVAPHGFDETGRSDTGAHTYLQRFLRR